MAQPNTPQGWAIRLSQIIKAYHAAHGMEPFPINVAEIASEFSKQVFPDAPITMVEGQSFSKKFEGMLIPHPSGNGEWGIIYNDSITSKGRINFTLAHELGHYLMHRHLNSDGIKCTTKDMYRWDSAYGQMEAEANVFASFLLMPLDDFRQQIAGEQISMGLMQHLSNRYGVSVSAAILKWLDITDKRAMIVVGKEGFIDWAWCSKPLIKSGVFYRARQDVVELPALSLAARNDVTVDNITGIKHPKGVWLGDEEVHEMTILARQGEMTISLLMYPDDAPNKWVQDEDEPEPFDSFDKFTDFEKRMNR